MTERRWERLKDALQEQSIRPALRSAFDQVRTDEAFRGYLRSVVLNGLLVQLRQVVVLYGMGDPRQVLGHAQLPVQFGSAPSDTLTVCERGSGGDGTVRAFVERAPDAFAQWKDEGVVVCPNAETDRLLQMVAERTEDHARWRSQNPRDAAWVEELAAELGEPADGGAMPVVLSMLYGDIEIEGSRLSNLDLYIEALGVRQDLRTQMGRQPSSWELVGGVLNHARSQSPTDSEWARLLQVYHDLEETPADGDELSPTRRVADQVHRLAAPFCVDGCQACLHGPHDQMDSAVAETVLSRTLLERYWRFMHAS